MKKTLVMLLALALFLPGSSLAKGQDAVNFWIEGEGLTSLAVFEGRLYGLGAGGLFLLDTDSKEACLLRDLQEAREDHILFDGQELEQLFADSEGLVAFDRYSNQLFRIRPDQEPATREFLIQVETGTQEFLYMGYAAYAAPHFFGYDYMSQTCYRVDITTGEVLTLSLENLRALAPMGDGRLVVIAGKQQGEDWTHALYALDFASGSQEQLMDLTGILTPSLAYEASSQTIYAASHNQLFTFRKGEEEATPLSYIPAGDNSSLVLLPAGRAALIVNGALVAVRSLNPDAHPARALTILDPVARAVDYQPFMKQHPDTELIFQSPNPQTPEERFAADMMTRSPEVDIYLLGDQNLLGQIKKKGYFLDLAGSAGIREAVSHLEMGFQAAVTREGQIAAVLREAYVGIPICNQEAFARLGLTVPTTYTEYFQLCLDYLNHHQADNPEWALAPFDNNLSLGHVLSQVAAELIKTGQPLDYETSEMKQLVGLINQVARAKPQAAPEDAAPLFDSRPLVLLPEGSTPMLLSFKKGQAPVLTTHPTGLAYLVVNPYSKNREAALAFVESYLKHLPSPQRLLMDTRATGPIEQPEYQGRLAQYEEQIKALKDSLAAAGEADRTHLEELIAEFEEMKQQLMDNERWWFGQAQVDQVRAQAPRVFIPDFNPVLLLLQTNPGFFEEIYTNESFDVDLFLSQLNQMVQTTLKEQE